MKWLFMLLWTGVTAFFGKSDGERLGIAETLVDKQTETLKDSQNAHNIETENRINLHDGDAAQRLRDKWS